MKYTVTGKAVELGVGQQLKLTAAQIDARRHVLEIDDDASAGFVTTTGIVTFKKGEEINLKEKFEDLPRSLQDVLTPSSKVPAEEKQKASSRKKASPAAGSGQSAPPEDDLDAIEERLENAETAYKAALEKNGIAAGAELTDEQKQLVATESEELEAANLAYAEAVGE